MTRYFSHLFFASAVVSLLVSCEHSAKEVPVKSEEKSAEEVARGLGNPLLANKGDIRAVTINVASEEELKNYNNGSDEELIWTDPDNPDAEIPNLTAVFENKKEGHGWQDDLGRAVSLARKQELPLIIWFHDSLLSPQSSRLGKEYLNTSDFLDWVRDKAILARLDSGASLDEHTAASAKYKADDVNALKKRYGLSGKPAFAVISPNGKIITRIDGFDGFVNGLAQELKDGVRLAQKKYNEHKAELVDAGFRNWKSARGDTTVFAKLMRVDPRQNVVFLRESGGRITRTKLSRFSKEDLEYIKSHRPEDN